jgi:hypothetical protein
MRTDASGPVRSGLATLALVGLLLCPAGCGGEGSGNGAPGPAGGGAGAGAGGNAGTAGSSGSPGGGGAPGPAGRDAGASPDTRSGTPPMGGNVDGGMSSGQPDAGAPPSDASLPPPDTAPAAPPPWVELTGAAINLQGGVASSAGGQGQPGGTVHLVSNQDIVLDPARAAAPAPVIPAVPADAVPVTALAGDLTTPRSARLGDVTVGGIEAVRTISAGAGDLFIEGSLRSADLGASRQGLALSAPAGTVYISGTVDTSGADGAGQTAGSITITALRVVITGRLDSSGGDSDRAGGAGGAITITAGQTVSVSGGIDTAGGNARGAAAATGGKAGDLTMQAVGDLNFGGHSRLRGGAAEGLGGDAQGGAAATLVIRTDGAVQIGGILDARGGLATAAAAGGRVAAGAPGALKVGEVNGRAPGSIALLSPVNASGGQGQTSGGKGGSFRAEPLGGNVIVRGPRAIDVSGGGAGSAPGAGGTVFVSGRRESSSAGLDVQGEIFADGGSVSQGGSGAGAAAGRIDATLVPLRGAIQVGSAGKLSAVGGRSGGSGIAGTGGDVLLITNDGDLTVAGTIAVVGGEAPDPGGTGGQGGHVILWSDQNGNANQVNGGNLLVATTGLIDASGGNGATGGSARNDGIGESVADFPSEQDKIAVLIDCDNVEGATLTWLENKGRIVARGGARNGSGGDIMFHGALPDGEEPVSGNIDLAGNGTGRSGDFGFD